MNANEKQIGGDHYKTKFEVWDFVHQCLGDRFLEGNICKYVARHSKKNGLQDLEKAQHYAEKLLEFHKYNQMSPHNSTCSAGTLNAFVILNDIGNVEKDIIGRLCVWSNSDNLQHIIRRINALKETYKSQ